MDGFRLAACAPESRDPSTLLRMTMPPALSLHSVECFLENFDIARATNLFSGVFNPLLFESVFSRAIGFVERSEEHTSELQSQFHLVCRLLLEKKNHDDFISSISSQRENRTNPYNT